MQSLKNQMGWSTTRYMSSSLYHNSCVAKSMHYALLMIKWLSSNALTFDMVKPELFQFQYLACPTATPLSAPKVWMKRYNELSPHLQQWR